MALVLTPHTAKRSHGSDPSTSNVSHDRASFQTLPPPQQIHTPPDDPESENQPRWNDLEICRVMTYRGHAVKPEVRADIDKGFFFSADGAWTTYRRNYFAASATFLIDTPGVEFYSRGDISISDGEQVRRVDELLLNLTAEVANSNEKSTELWQHTPERNTSSRSSPTLFSVIPSGARPHYQKEQSSTVQWDRVQFRLATANNGRRRAQQQYYHLMVELLAAAIGGDGNATTFCVARRRSEPLVVRGRSPSHYQNKESHSGHHIPSNTLQSGSTITLHDSERQLRVNEGPNFRSTLRSHDKLGPAVSSPDPHQDSDHAKTGQFAPSRQAFEKQKHGHVAVDHERNEDDPGYNHSEQSAPTHEVHVIPPEAIAYDDSSISSHDTERDVSSAIDTLSTASSVNNSTQALDFIAGFFRLRGVDKLCMDCFAVSTPERCERNIRRLLKSFGSRLVEESKEELERRVARVFRKQGDKMASRIAELCRAESLSTKPLPLASLEPFPDFSMSRYLAEHDALESEPSIVPIAFDGVPDVSDHESNDEVSFDGSIVGDLALDTQKGEVLLFVALDFLRNSEAIEDLREELLDFRIGLENAKHKESTQPTHHDGTETVQEAVLVNSAAKHAYTFWRNLTDRLQEWRLPSLRPGYRRISWRCDCGKVLHADFDNTDNEAVDALSDSLNGLRTHSHEPLEAQSSQNTTLSGSANLGNLPSSRSQAPCDNNTASSAPAAGISNTSMLTIPSPTRPSKYLAICMSTKRIYKTLIELDVTDLTSDASLFAAMKREYRAARGYKAHFASLFKPVSVEFVHFSLWNIRHGLVSICDRPECVPPPSALEYEFLPKPLLPLPPMPPEIFIHYLEHGDGDLLPTRCDWLPRLPKRLDGRMIDMSDGPCYGWGIYIREGPNRDTIFWMLMGAVGGSVVLGVCWAAVRGDVQGGSGLGTLVLTLPTVVMGAFIFRFTNHE